MVAALMTLSWAGVAAPPGPEVQIPEGGSAPGPFPNTSVTAVNVIARGSDVFDGSVEITGFEGEGPIPWSINRYNRGDIALRLSPADPEAAAGSLNQGFIEFADTATELPASHAWRPSPAFGVVIPTARQNGPIDWGDGEVPFYPLIGVSEASSAPGYDMATGTYGTGHLDITTGRAGGLGSSPEANFAFSVAWFPYDAGWLGGEAAGPLVDDPVLPPGMARWTSPDAHAAGLAPGVVQWREFPEGSFLYGGVAEVRLPGVNTLEDGMLFATSADGGSDVNIVGVAPREDGSSWIITIREHTATDAETLVGADQSEFQFVYVPFDAPGLVGGHIQGNGTPRVERGEFTVSRTGTGVYEITIPGKTGESGALILQAADMEQGTSEPLATRAFLSYEFADGRFVVQSQKVSDNGADLADAAFYFAWIDFEEPLTAPEGPRMRSRGPVMVSLPDVPVSEAGIAAHATEPEVLVTTIDVNNFGGYTDPVTGEFALSALVGRFHNAVTLEPLGEPFVIVGNPTGQITRHDVKFNPASNQYVVVANARTYGPSSLSIPLIALVNPAGQGDPVARAFAFREDSPFNFDDVAVAVSTNGNFLFVAEYSFPDEGEGVVAALFNAEGELLTSGEDRLDLLQAVGDEDDPDVIYLEDRDVFLYITNTDNAGGEAGPYSNRIVGAVVDAVPDSEGNLVTRTEQAMTDGEPAGQAEGHPSAILNPFNGEVIVAFDAGNGTAIGDLAYVRIGAAPEYTFTPAREEVSYLAGADGNPFNHQHPQLAADPDHGVLIVGFNATGSSVGFADAYAFTLLGPDGTPLPSQLGGPWFLADAPGGLSTGANFHNVKYSAPADAFLVAYTTTSPSATYLAALEVTSNHLGGGGDQPTLAVSRDGEDILIRWPASAEGFVLQSAGALGPDWLPVSEEPVTENGTTTVRITPDSGIRFFRLYRAQ